MVRTKSQFLVAAWYSLITPFAMAATIALFYYLEDASNAESQRMISNFLQFGLLICISSLIAGIISLFGIPRHGTRIIVWKATIGIVASCALGCGIVYLAFANIFRSGC